MKITNRTLRPQGFLLDKGWLAIEPLTTLDVTSPAQIDELKSFLQTPSGKRLLDQNIIAVDWSGANVSPVEVPSPEPPEELKPKRKGHRSKAQVTTEPEIVEGMAI